MFNTSADILNWTLAFSAAALSFFLCWAIYYFIASAQKIFRLLKRLEAGLAQAEEVLGMIRSRLKNSSAYFMILAEVAKKAMDIVNNRRNKIFGRDDFDADKNNDKKKSSRRRA